MSSSNFSREDHITEKEADDAIFYDGSLSNEELEYRRSSMLPGASCFNSIGNKERTIVVDSLITNDSLVHEVEHLYLKSHQKKLPPFVPSKSAHLVCSRLKVLPDLSSCHTIVLDCPKLKELSNFDNCHTAILKNLTVDNCRAVQNCQVVKIESCHGINPSGSLRSVKRVELKDMYITNVSSFKEAEELILKNVFIQDLECTDITLPKLKVLHLTKTNATSIENCPELETLRICGELSLRKISNCPKLVNLEFGGISGELFEANTLKTVKIGGKIYSLQEETH